MIGIRLKLSSKQKKAEMRNIVKSKKKKGKMSFINTVRNRVFSVASYFRL
jgi:hypothetical protein